MERNLSPTPKRMSRGRPYLESVNAIFARVIFVKDFAQIQNSRPAAASLNNPQI